MGKEDEFIENPDTRLILFLAVVSYLIIRWGIWAYQANEWFHFFFSCICIITPLCFFLGLLVFKLISRSSNIFMKSLVVLITCSWLYIVIYTFRSEFGFHELIKKDNLILETSEKELKPNRKVKFAVTIYCDMYCEITRIIFKPDVNKNDSLVNTYTGVPGSIVGGTDQGATSRKTFEYSFTSSQDPRYAQIMVDYEKIYYPPYYTNGYLIAKKSTGWVPLF